MNNSSLAFLADKVGMWECFFFAKPLLEKIAVRSLFQSSPFFSRNGRFCDLRLQPRATSPASHSGYSY